MKVFVEALDSAEKQSEEFVDHTVWTVILLILIFLFGLFIVLVCQPYFSKGVFGLL